MSLKKKLFFSDNGVKKSMNKIISIKIKTGENLTGITEREYQENRLIHKYMKNKIYPHTIVLESDEDKIYFESEKMCELLLNNKCIYNLRTPKLFLDSVYKLLEDIDEQIYVISCYMPKMYLIEHELIDIVEKYREIENPCWYIIFKTLSKSRKLIKTICSDTYDELLELYMDITKLRFDSIYTYKTIIESIRVYEKIKKKYDEINKPTHIYTDDNLKKIEFNNNGRYKIQKIYEYIECEYDAIIDTCKIEI